MKLQLSGWKATAAKWIATMSIIMLFMGGGALVGIAPHTAWTAPVGLVLLVGGFYTIVSTRERRRNPRHVHASAAMLSCSYVFFVGATVAQESWMSVPGLIASGSLLAMLAFGYYKDHVLGDYDSVDDFKLEVLEGQ